MSTSKPDLQWTPATTAPARPRRGRAWLIVLLIVVALAIVGALVFFLLPRGEGPLPDPSQTPTAAPTATATPDPQETTPAPEESVIPDPPPIVEPEVDAFAADVAPVLNDAVTGLSYLDGATGTEALEIVDVLQDDLQRLGERVVPAAVSADWYAALDRYADSLEGLRRATVGGTDPTSAVAEARAAVDALRGVVGL